MNAELKQVDFTQFTPLSFEGHNQIVALMEHVASGAANEWAVYANGSCVGRYKEYEEANRVFENTGDNLQTTLHLYTRVGTSVVFRYKE